MKHFEIVLTSSRQAFATTEIQAAVKLAIDSDNNVVSEIKVPGDDRRGWVASLNEFNLIEQDLEFYSLGCTAGVYNPYDDLLFVVPADWVETKALNPNDYVLAPTESENANSDFKRDLDMNPGTVTYKLCGIYIFPQSLGLDEDY